jgi:hypothetical protein
MWAKLKIVKFIVVLYMLVAMYMLFKYEACHVFLAKDFRLNPVRQGYLISSSLLWWVDIDKTYKWEQLTSLSLCPPMHRGVN